jgi:putative ABC transport system permease protein
MNYAAMQRKKELGIRVALGASRQTVVGLILRDVAAIVAVGGGIGILAAMFTTRLAKALLFGLAPNDTTTLLTASLLLLAASLLAAFIPAYRAAGADPMTALHYD